MCHNVSRIVHYRNDTNGTKVSQSLTFALMLAENLVMTSWCMMMATKTVPREWHYYIADMTLVTVLSLVSWAFQVVYYKISHTWAEINFNPSISSTFNNDVPMHQIV